MIPIQQTTKVTNVILKASDSNGLVAAVVSGVSVFLV